LPAGNRPSPIPSHAWTADKIIAALQHREADLRNLSFDCVQKNWDINPDNTLTLTATITQNIKFRGDDFRITQSWEDSLNPEKSVPLNDQSVVNNFETHLWPQRFFLRTSTPQANAVSLSTLRSRSHVYLVQCVNPLALQLGGHEEPFSKSIASSLAM